MTNKAEYIEETRAKYDAYDVNLWEKSYFDELTGGYVVTEVVRIAQSKKSKNEQRKFDKEFGMCLTLAQNGYAVEYLEDNPNSYDIHLNGIRADLKKTKGHNNVVNYAKKAVYEQGAEMLVFEFDENSKKLQEELDKLKRSGIRVHYYYSFDKSKIYKL